MKKAVITISVLVAVLGPILFAACWLYISLRSKSKWDDMAKTLTNTYAVVTMDQPTEAYLADVQSNWFRQYDEVGGPISEGMTKVAGVAPSVSNLIGIINYRK